MSLEDIHIMKSFKYIRRIPDGKGGWRYIYEEPKGKYREGSFGRVWGNFSGRTMAAFMTLFSKRSGQCMDVFEAELPVFYPDKDGKLQLVKENGKLVTAKTSIDLVWGDKRRNMGLEHIVQDHYVEHDDFDSIEDLISTITKEMENVDFQNPENWENQFVRNDRKRITQVRLTTPNGHKFVFVINIEQEKSSIAKESLEKKYLMRHYILTSYDKSTPLVENSSEEKLKRERIFENFGIKIEPRS